MSKKKHNLKGENWPTKELQVEVSAIFVGWWFFAKPTPIEFFNQSRLFFWAKHSFSGCVEFWKMAFHWIFHHNLSFICCQNVVLVVDAEKLIPRGRKEGVQAVTLAVVENSPLGWNCTTHRFLGSIPNWASNQVQNHWLVIKVENRVQDRRRRLLLCSQIYRVWLHSRAIALKHHGTQFTNAEEIWSFNL